MALGNRRACENGECRPNHRKLAQSVNCLFEHRSDLLKDIAGKLAGEREIHYPKSALYEFANAYHEDHLVRVPLCVIDAVEDLYGTSVVTEAMARRRGGRFVQLPIVDAGTSTDVQQRSKAIQEFGEALQMDGRDPDLVVAEIDDAIGALLIMRQTQLARKAFALRPRPQAVGAR